MCGSEKVTIKRYKNGVLTCRADVVAVEKTYRLNLDEVYIETMTCSPMDLKSLAIGRLFTLGLIKGAGRIKAIEIKADDIFVSLGAVSDSGVIKKSAAPLAEINPAAVLKQMEIFSENSPLFLNTGGVHAAGVLCGDRFVIFEEDIGRHNAIDKAIGVMLFKGMAFEDKILFLSSRMSKELIEKVVVSGIKVVAALGVPTDEAIRLADEKDITLIGMIREKRMNIYSGFHRIKE